MIPRDFSLPRLVHAMSLNLRQIDLISVIPQYLSSATYRESVLMLALGCSSWPCRALSRSKSHNSNCVSLEKPSSTAPAFVPVAKYGEEAPGDQANVAVLGISRRPTMSTSAPVLLEVQGDIWQLARREGEGTSNGAGAAVSQAWSKSTSVTSTSPPCNMKSKKRQAVLGWIFCVGCVLLS